MEHLPLAVHTLYAELFELCRSAPAVPEWPLGASLVSVPVKGARYWYLQHSRRAGGGGQRREYLGPAGEPGIEERVHAFRQAKAAHKERRSVVASLKAAGAAGPAGPMAALVEELGWAGILGRAVVVGTQAFQAYSAMLGLRLAGAAIQTLDLDLAQGRSASLAAPPGGGPALLGALRGLDPGFREVPGLDVRTPATSFVNPRGLRVDVLTPLTGREKACLPAPDLGCYGSAQRFLDFLVHDPVPAVLLAGGGVSCSVPRPERYALHKLLVAMRRGPHEAAKRRKDLVQAGQLLAFLLENDREGVHAARADLVRRGAGWRKALAAGLAALPAGAALGEVLGGPA
jgi:hypothetical protein